MTRYYDTRYFVLPVFTFLKTHSSSSSSSSTPAGVDQKGNGSSSLLTELVLLTFFSALFLLMSIRVQLCCFFHPLPGVGRIELRIGGTELSVPVTLSLVATLFVPSSSAFWSIYLFILVASFFSDAIHSFVACFSYHLCFVLSAPHQDEEPVLPVQDV